VLPLNLVVITACLWVALPVAISIFPQQSAIPVQRLEQKYHSLKDEQGTPITQVYYNKGL